MISMFEIDIDKEMEDWEDSIEDHKAPLKGEVTISTSLNPKKSYLDASFSEPKPRQTKRSKEVEVDLKKNKRGNKKGLF